MAVAGGVLARIVGRLRALFNLNDPQWGSGGGKDGGDERSPNDVPDRSRTDRPQSPPDLDELWRDFNRRLSSMIGGRNGGGDGGGARGGRSPEGATAGVGVGLIIVVIAAVWLLSGVFIVQEGQQAVVLQFGKYKYTSPAGINWRMPWPIQSHEIVNVSNVRSVEVGGSNLIRATNLKDASMLTEDENIIDVRFAVQYRLKDATEFLFNNRDAEDSVKQAAETAVREIVGKSKMDFVLYEGREKIALDLNQSIQRILDSYKTGILVTSVTMQNVQPPEQVQAAFDDAVKAGQDRERLKNEGQAYANDVVPRAGGMAARLLQEAEGYKARVVSQAEGDASRFKQIQAEYSKAPQVTRDRLQIEAMQQIYTNTTKVLVDVRQGSNLLYLPLDKLVAQNDGKTAASTANGTASTTTPEPAAGGSVLDLRSREIFRGRDRESR